MGQRLARAKIDRKGGVLTPSKAMSVNGVRLHRLMFLPVLLQVPIFGKDSVPFSAGFDINESYCQQ